jgi:hypothetical protein
VSARYLPARPRPPLDRTPRAVRTVEAFIVVAGGLVLGWFTSVLTIALGYGL